MSDKKNIVNYGKTDQAKTHKLLKPNDNRNSPKIDADYDALMQDGYVIIENLISEEACLTIKRQTSGLLEQTGRNTFEGLKTQRIYDVLSKTRLVDDFAVHPRILGLMDKFFSPGYLLSQSQIINILPGEASQELHTDDAFYRLPRPRQPLGAAAIWAVDDFTNINGATVVIPNSHLWGDNRQIDLSEVVAAEMPAGSVLFFLGTTWHGGGKNKSDSPRMALTHQYCDAYMRQQENYLLELSKGTVRSLSPELQALVGYSVYPPFMGMVEGKHPLRVLDRN